MITVVIATMNRPRALEACLMSLVRQTEKDFDVIVVSDGHWKSQNQVCENAEQMGLSVRHMHNFRMKTAGESVNAGVAEAKTRWIYLSDDDCIFHKEAVGKMINHLLEGEDEAIYSGPVLVNGNNFWAVHAQDYINYLIEWYDGQFFSTSNLAMSKKKFEDLGGFLPLICYDREWYHRLEKYKLGQVEFIPDAIVFHDRNEGRMTYGNLLRQRRRYGEGSFQFYKQTGEPFMPLKFYLGEITYPFRSKSLNPIEGLLHSLVALTCRLSQTLGYMDAYIYHREISKQGLA